MNTYITAIAAAALAIRSNWAPLKREMKDSWAVSKEFALEFFRPSDRILGTAVLVVQTTAAITETVTELLRENNKLCREVNAVVRKQRDAEELPTWGRVRDEVGKALGRTVEGTEIPKEEVVRIQQDIGERLSTGGFTTVHVG